MNILLLDGGKDFGHSHGKLNHTLQQKAKEVLTALGHHVKETVIDVGYDIETEVDLRNLNTKILSASFKNCNQVIDSLVNGAHTSTIPYDILVQMVNKDIAINAIKVFNEDGKITK